MSTIIKTLDLGESYSKFRQELHKIDSDRVEVLLTLYKVFPQDYPLQIKALEDELTFRKTSLGKELL